MNTRLLEAMKEYVLKHHKEVLDYTTPDWVKCLNTLGSPDMQCPVSEPIYPKNLAKVFEVSNEAVTRLVLIGYWSPTNRKRYWSAKTTRQKAKVIGERIDLFISSGGAV